MLLLATEVWKNHGGIQRYMQLIARILSDRGEEFVTLSLLDDCRPDRAEMRSLVGCRGNKLRFCIDAFRLALTRSRRTIIVGHVALLPVVWALQKARATSRYVVVLHGIEAWRRLPWISRLAARSASAIVATTFYTAREFCFHNQVESGQCVVIPLASALVASSGRRTSLDSELKLLTVTRLSRSDTYKGVETVLRAVRLGRDSGLRLTLDILGDGDDRNRLESVTRALGIQSFVRFHGSFKDQELEEHFSASHVFAMPSKKEGFGIVYLEAMAAGLPCIGANHGGTPEVIEHGESGFLIEYGDVEQMVFYLRAIIESPSLYRTMSDAARRRATQTLSLTAMAHSWGTLLDSLQSAVNPASRQKTMRIPFVDCGE